MVADIENYRFGNFLLRVVEKGFVLQDAITDEILLDGSIMDSHWSVEGIINTKDRPNYLNLKDGVITFGFGELNG
jgi:hypothetical protein